MIVSGVIADTHIIVWYLDSPGILSHNATLSLDTVADDPDQRIYLSAITLVELQYLTEKGKINPPVLPQLLAALDRPQPILEVIPIDRNITNSVALIPRSVVPEMPDRIIAATALKTGLPLITMDKKIRALTNIQLIV
ncbi:MAG: type II toxin-antitoxin system VapC family toxin [Blastocatellia bacterium]